MTARTFVLRALEAGDWLVLRRDDQVALATGDVVIALVDDGRRTFVHPPAVVAGGAEPAPGRRSHRRHPLRRPPDLAPVPIGMATASFRAAGVRSASPFAEGEVTSPERRAALLGLWALGDAD